LSVPAALANDPHLKVWLGCVGISEKKLLNSGTRSSRNPPARLCSR
jgi:hypothetical protein